MIGSGKKGLGLALKKDEVVTPVERGIRTEGDENLDPKGEKEEVQKQPSKSTTVSVEKASLLGPDA